MLQRQNSFGECENPDFFTEENKANEGGPGNKRQPKESECQAVTINKVTEDGLVSYEVGCRQAGKLKRMTLAETGMPWSRRDGVNWVKQDAWCVQREA